MANNHSHLTGKWRIVATSLLDRDYLDLCGPATLTVDSQGRGEMAYGALEATLDCDFTVNGIAFDWNGSDERDQVEGDGWAELTDDGILEGEIAYRNGDETTFRAVQE